MVRNAERPMINYINRKVNLRYNRYRLIAKLLAYYCCVMFYYNILYYLDIFFEQFIRKSTSRNIHPEDIAYTSLFSTALFGREIHGRLEWSINKLRQHSHARNTRRNFSAGARKYPSREDPYTVVTWWEDIINGDNYRRVGHMARKEGQR